MTQEIETPGAGSFLHPAAGGLILGLDWLLFSSEMATGGLALPLAAVLGFVVAGLGTSFIQRFWAKEGWGRALLKGILAGIVVGVPVPIGGTLVGGAVLASSGLDQLRHRAARALAEQARAQAAPRQFGDK